MPQYNTASQLLAIGLAALAGYVDAHGYLYLGGFFASFMTGNTTRLAIGMAGETSGAALAAGLIGLFVVGVMLGAWATSMSEARRSVLVLVLETGLLTGAAVMDLAEHRDITVMLMVLAMGAENAVLQHNGDVAVKLTYMTGTLVKFGERLAAALGGHDRLGWLPYLSLWCGFVAGAFVGAHAYALFQLDGLVGAAAAAAGLTAYAALISRHVAPTRQHAPK